MIYSYTFLFESDITSFVSHLLRLRKRIRFGMPGTPLSKLKAPAGEDRTNDDGEEEDDRRPLIHVIETDENLEQT